MNAILEIPFWLAPLFFLVATVYSSVGFGGGSSYLALLVLAGFPLTQIAPVGLFCNLAVTGIGVAGFLRSGNLDIRRALPFVTTSIPAAYVGGAVPVGKTLFLFLLGLSLFSAALRLFMRDVSAEANVEGGNFKICQRWWAPAVGGILGFLSGLIGIGGGIFLSPVLFLTCWGSARQIAATASFFIFVNSVSGLMGQLMKGRTELPLLAMLSLGIAVVTGALMGSRLATNYLPGMAIRRVTAALILIVSLNVLWRWSATLGGGA